MRFKNEQTECYECETDGKRRMLRSVHGAPERGERRRTRATVTGSPVISLLVSRQRLVLPSPFDSHHLVRFFFLFFHLLVLVFKSATNPLFFFVFLFFFPWVNFYRNFLAWFNFLGLGFCELVCFIEVNRIYKWNKY